MSSGRRPEGRSLHDFLAALRRRRKLAGAVFVATVAGYAAFVLHVTPSYRAQATIQIDAPGGSGLLGELATLQGGSRTEAEMEIMRSHQVARGAFLRLAPSDFLLEENAYRPREVLLRHFGASRPRCALAVSTAAAETSERWRFVFEGDALHVEKRPVEARSWFSDDVERATIRPVRFGEPTRVLGRDFTFSCETDPTGRAFTLFLYTPDDGARVLRQRTRVREVGRLSGVVTLAFEAETPELARRGADALAASYLALKQEHRREWASNALTFLRREMEQVGRRLRAAEEALNRFQAESGAVQLSERARWLVEKSNALALERTDLRVLLEEQRRLLAEARDDAHLDRLLGATDGRNGDPLSLSLAGELARLELQRDGMEREGLLLDHPRRAVVESEVASARTRLAALLRAGLAERVRSTETRLAHLEDVIASLETEARGLPETERRIAELTRDVQANLEIHGFLVQKEQEAQIAQASTLASARLIDHALLPRERSSPKLVLQLLVAVVLAAAGSALVAAAVDALDHSVKDARDLEEALGLPLFASIPDFRTVRGCARRNGRHPLVARERPHSPLGEAYRTLRTNLRFARLERPVRTLAITSSTPAEGKTLTTANFAVACAQLGDRVIVIDADLRMPRTHALFGNRPEPGLSDVLEARADWRAAIQPGGTPGLDLLHAGSAHGEPGALLQGARFRALLEALKEIYDWVLVDVPPVLAVSDASGFLPALDGVLLLVRCGRPPIDTVLDARAQLDRVGTKLLGAIFNGYDARIAREGRYGYDDRYYGNGNGRAAAPESRRTPVGSR